MSSPAAARRDRYGRRFYPVPHPETKEIFDLPGWTRVKKLMASEPLETWKLKTVGRTIARRADLQMLAADESQTYGAVKQALDANQNKANVGTAVHRYTEYIDADALDWEIVPPVMVPWLQHYIAAKERYGWTMIETEASVFNITVGYAGTPDRFALIPDIGVVPFDLKTGEHVWAETALQLAAYGNAEGFWLPPTDQQLPEYWAKLQELERDIAAGENFTQWGAPRSKKWSEHAKKIAYGTLDDLYWEEFAQWPGHRPMPEGLRTDVGYVAHLTAEGCELVPLKLDGEPSSFDVVKALCVQFQWGQREKDIVGEPLAKEEDASSPDSSSSDMPAAPSGSDAAGVGEQQPSEGEPAAPPADSPPKRRSRKAAAEPKPRFSESLPSAEWLVARILELPEAPRDELARRWPEGIPTFKTSRDQTPEQLQAIDAVLKDVEANFELPFVDRPTVAVEATEPTQSEVPTPSPELVTAEEREKLIALIGRLDQPAIERVTAQKNEAGIPNVKSPTLTAAQAAHLRGLVIAQVQDPTNQGEAQAA